MLLYYKSMYLPTGSVAHSSSANYSSCLIFEGGIFSDLPIDVQFSRIKI